jgi:hypothetical protein
MTSALCSSPGSVKRPLIPAEAGNQAPHNTSQCEWHWVPASAGMSGVMRLEKIDARLQPDHTGGPLAHNPPLAIARRSG